jgi:hypothetical protein
LFGGSGNNLDLKKTWLYVAPDQFLKSRDLASA